MALSLVLVWGCGRIGFERMPMADTSDSGMRGGAMGGGAMGGSAMTGGVGASGGSTMTGGSGSGGSKATGGTKSMGDAMVDSAVDAGGNQGTPCTMATYTPDNSCGVGYCMDNNVASACVDGFEVACMPASPLAAEDTTCDGVDDDCDGMVDESATGVPDWWDASFKYRRRLDFDNSGQSEALDNFVVLVVLRASGATAFDYSHAQANGQDLRFIDDDGVTLLKHHVERWQPSGDSYVWVRVNRIDAASSTDHIWLYHGNPSASAIDDEAGTYASDFAAVFHLDESSGDYQDSVAGVACAWQAQTGSTRGSTGTIGAAMTIDNFGGILCPVDSLLGLADYTITVWLRPQTPASSSNYSLIINDEDISASPYPGPGLNLRNSDLAVAPYIGNGFVTSTSTVSTSTWSMVALRVTVDSTAGLADARINNGAWETLSSGNTTEEEVVAGSSLVVGAWQGPSSGAATPFAGDIDELRISNVARSNDYLTVEYMSQTDTLITPGAEETATCQ